MKSNTEYFIYASHIISDELGQNKNQNDPFQMCLLRYLIMEIILTEAKLSTESFIFSCPNLVTPKTSPKWVIWSANSKMW